eukprot:1174323-Rhodomonas_salina.2
MAGRAGGSTHTQGGGGGGGGGGGTDRGGELAAETEGGAAHVVGEERVRERGVGDVEVDAVVDEGALPGLGLLDGGRRARSKRARRDGVDADAPLAARLPRENLGRREEDVRWMERLSLIHI